MVGSPGTQAPSKSHFGTRNRRGWKGPAGTDEPFPRRSGSSGGSVLPGSGGRPSTHLPWPSAAFRVQHGFVVSASERPRFTFQEVTSRNTLELLTVVLSFQFSDSCHLLSEHASGDCFHVVTCSDTFARGVGGAVLGMRSGRGQGPRCVRAARGGLSAFHRKPELRAFHLSPVLGVGGYVEGEAQ